VALCDFVGRRSARDTIPIVAESGTGKELVACALHECGAAPTAPFASKVARE